MPPRRGGAADPEKKKRDFEEFYGSEEYKHLQFLFKMRKQSEHELKDLHNGSDDILGEWTDILAAVFKLVEGFKVPGRKSKSYDQNIFRTMVFKRVQDDFIKIDGVTYEVVNSVNQDHFDCKEKFLNIFFHIEQGMDDDYLQVDTLAGWKKDLINKLKDFEKKYVKHAKSTNPILSKIHLDSMQPVVDLYNACVNLDNFHKLSKTRSFPEFRKKALTEKFVQHLTIVCEILKCYPNPEGKMLDQEYSIAHILELLELEGWEEVPPLRFYFEPLQKAYRELVKVLRDMHKAGPLHCSYYVERNLAMTKKIYELVRQYNIVGILAGDELKRDQFKFIYKIHDMVYSCALKDYYLTSAPNSVVRETVIPELTVFFTMLHVRDIDDKKRSDDLKKKKKAEERAALGLSEEEEEELKLDLPTQPTTKKGKKKVEVDPEIIEQARIAALFKRELARYGRTWVWEGYYKDDDDRKNAWLAGAAALRKINDQVLEDIEDFLMLKGFKQGPGMLNIEAIHKRIQNDVQQKRERLAMEQ
mmetsp:Transcript_46190/g.61151  ORF Transcript_46190/g.61151 Transcript_46190/m.61151 type:complete len:529 (+) Transcript_46190:35-1621(+)